MKVYVCYWFDPCNYTFGAPEKVFTRKEDAVAWKHAECESTSYCRTYIELELEGTTS